MSTDYFIIQWMAAWFSVQVYFWLIFLASRLLLCFFSSHFISRASHETLFWRKKNDELWTDIANVGYHDCQCPLQNQREGFNRNNWKSAKPFKLHWIRILVIFSGSFGVFLEVLVFFSESHVIYPLKLIRFVHCISLTILIYCRSTFIFCATTTHRI